MHKYKKKLKNKTYVVAEIGCNHKGDVLIAKKMILAAKNAGADYVKFQKRDNKYLLGSQYYEPHPVAENSYGKNYGEHRDFLEFSINQHKDLFKFCKKHKIKYSVSVWEKNSAIEFVKSKLPLEYIKVPSACNTDFELLEYLGKKFKKKIHISLGMTSDKEINQIFSLFKKLKRTKDLVFYSCTSDYPVKNEDVHLLDVIDLRKKFERKIEAIAFSGHHLGISHDVAAVTLGAKFVERHFTLDRTWKGTDHAASLEPQGLTKLVRDINLINNSLKSKPGNKILKCEFNQRNKLKRFKKN